MGKKTRCAKTDSTAVVAFDFDTGEVAFTVENTPVRVINAIKNEIRIIVDCLNTFASVLENFYVLFLNIFKVLYRKVKLF